jgi:hypothetical protein
MIRPFTCLCLVAAFGSGLYLYSEKHRTTMLDRQISAVINQTEAARARTGLLRAEWALLNEPGRLQDMANKYLALKPMAPTQFVALADLPAHLPAPQTAAEMQADASAAQTQDDAAPTPPAADDANPLMADSHPDIVLPKRVLVPKPEGPSPPKLLAHLDTKPKSRRVAVADRAYTPPGEALARGIPLPLASPQPVAHVFSAMARPMPQPSYHAQIAAVVPHYTQPYVGSALGGRSALPPPVPYGGE